MADQNLLAPDAPPAPLTRNTMNQKHRAVLTDVQDQATQLATTFTNLQGLFTKITALELLGDDPAKTLIDDEVALIMPGATVQSLENFFYSLGQITKFVNGDGSAVAGFHNAAIYEVGK